MGEPRQTKCPHVFVFGPARRGKRPAAAPSKKGAAKSRRAQKFAFS
jgi:hypothetical protein